MNDVGKMRFAADRPKSCEYCHWWQGRMKGCGLGGEAECYYRLPDGPEGKERSECDGCPYGKASPCIGYCIKKIRKERGGPWTDSK